ncbi:MAG: hypothetical protein RSB75_02965 [Anaerovoracaceae bacterium]
MDKRKQVKIHNKSNKPDNIVNKEHEIIFKSEEIEDQLPSFLRGYFRYIESKVLPMSRLAYLKDVSFFCDYLIAETALTNATTKKDLKQKDFQKITAVDVNMFLDYCRKYKKEIKDTIYIYENNNITLSRKKYSI